ncbi:MAG TPA: DinB family protein [Gemmatimonadaceae bacterium]|jgi:uncharacterized damage-inducible protein DinB
MAFADTFLPEFDNEMKTTRSLLAIVPFENATWKPHTKSTALGPLASHITGLAGFGSMIATTTERVFGQPGQPKPPQYTNSAELLSAFDANVQKSRDALAGMSEDDLNAGWTLRNGDHVIFTLPRRVALRTMLMNHMIHHRGQLSVYLRLNDVPLPSIYGPTADT